MGPPGWVGMKGPSVPTPIGTGEDRLGRIWMITGSNGNEPFGSRPEPGTHRLALIQPLPPGEVPEGKAGVRIHARGYCA